MLEEAKLFSSTVNTGSWWDKPVPAAPAASPVPRADRDGVTSCPRDAAADQSRYLARVSVTPGLHLLPEETWFMFPCCCRQSVSSPGARPGGGSTRGWCWPAWGSGLGPAPCRTSRPLAWHHGWRWASAAGKHGGSVGNPGHCPRCHGWPAFHRFHPPVQQTEQTGLMRRNQQMFDEGRSIFCVCPLLTACLYPHRHQMLDLLGCCRGQVRKIPPVCSLSLQGENHAKGFAKSKKATWFCWWQVYNTSGTVPEPSVAGLCHHMSPSRCSSGGV